jgi:hypothetical protein
MRTLTQRISLAVIKFLDLNKSGTAFANVPFYTGNGTTLTGEVAGNPPVPEPTLPFFAVAATMTASDELPQVYDVEITIHLKTDGEDPSATRQFAELALQDVKSVFRCPPDTEEPPSDTNPEFGMFFDFVNAPDFLPDERPAYITPIHFYSLHEESAPTMFLENVWHDQLSFIGVAQDMNSSDPEPAPEPEP